MNTKQKKNKKPSGSKNEKAALSLMHISNAINKMKSLTALLSLIKWGFFWSKKRETKPKRKKRRPTKKRIIVKKWVHFCNKNCTPENIKKKALKNKGKQHTKWIKIVNFFSCLQRNKMYKNCLNKMLK